MNYQQILNMIKQFAVQHKQIKCFGYGNISDIEVPVDPNSGLPVQRDYAYMFLNPSNHSITAQTITYRFNVIVMDLASELQPTGFSGLNSTIKAQSDALLIINDLLAWIEYNNQYDTELVKNTSITPFKERFNDTVAGMTATLEFVVPNQLNLCDAPVEEVYLEVWQDTTQTVGTNPNEDRILDLNQWTTTSNPLGLWNGTRYYPLNQERIQFTSIELTMKFKLIGAGAVPTPPSIAQSSNNINFPNTFNVGFFAPTAHTGWPTISAVSGDEFEATITWGQFVAAPVNPNILTYFYEFRWPLNSTPQMELEVSEIRAKFYV